MVVAGLQPPGISAPPPAPRRACIKAIIAGPQALTLSLQPNSLARPPRPHLDVRPLIHLNAAPYRHVLACREVEPSMINRRDRNEVMEHFGNAAHCAG